MPKWVWATTMSELNLLLRNSDMPCGATALTVQVHTEVSECLCSNFSPLSIWCLSIWCLSIFCWILAQLAFVGTKPRHWQSKGSLWNYSFFNGIIPQTVTTLTNSLTRHRTLPLYQHGNFPDSNIYTNPATESVRPYSNWSRISPPVRLSS